jgi:integrase
MSAAVYRQAGRKTYMMRYQQNGQQICKSTGETDKAKAESVYKQAVAAIDRGEQPAILNKVTWEQAVADLRADYVDQENDSWDDTERRLALHLTPYFARRKLASITVGEIKKYKEHRRGQTYIPGSRVEKNGRVITGRGKPKHYSSAQISRELEILKRVFNLQVELGQLSILPPKITMVGDPKKAVRKGFLTPAQISEIAAHLPHPIDKAVVLAFITGWRIADEVLTLEWAQIDLDAGEMRIWKGGDKSGEGRLVYLTDDMRAIFTSLAAERKAHQKQGLISPFVFVRVKARGRRGLSPQHRGYHECPRYLDRVKTITKPWNKARAATGYAGQIPHNMRRSAARIMERRGVPRGVAKAIIGHQTDSMYDRYNIADHDDLVNAATQLSGQFPEFTATKTATTSRHSQAHAGGRTSKNP